MAIPPGTHTLGPEDGSLTVRTGKTGPAAKAGHELLIEVGAWEATIDAGDDPAATSMTLTADSRTLHVLEGKGGVGPLGGDEKAAIRQSIDDDVLKGGTIAFRSTSVTPQDDGGLYVAGELDLLGTTRPVDFVLTAGDDGRLHAAATVRQTAWGIKPFSILFGTMKVADDVRVELDAGLPKTR
jgi:polyisoprenoid-binding protein YceI